MKRHFYTLFAILSILLFCSFSLFEIPESDDYKAGYYMKGNEKIDGYIYFPYNTYQKFYFKESLNDKKQVIRAEDCSGFFVDDKRFDVITNLKLKVGIHSMFARYAFAEVVIEGPLNMYLIYSQVGNANMSAPGSVGLTDYVLKKNNSSNFVFVYGNHSKFRKEIIPLVSDRQELVEMINKKMYARVNVKKLVEAYNKPKSE